MLFRAIINGAQSESAIELHVFYSRKWFILEAFIYRT